VACAEVGDEVGAEEVARGAEGPEDGRAAVEVPDGPHRGAGGLGGVQDRDGVGAQRLAGLGDDQAAPDPVEELDGELGLQATDLVRQRGLCHVQVLGRGAEGAVLTGGEEILELRQGQG
jgi:hypothetical protein